MAVVLDAPVGAHEAEPLRVAESEARETGDAIAIFAGEDSAFWRARLGLDTQDRAEMGPVAEARHLLGDVEAPDDGVRTDNVFAHAVGVVCRSRLEQLLRLCEQRRLRGLEAEEVVKLKVAYD